ncbi:MAG: PAS domain S-box protein [Fimbriimonas sp.]
MTWRDAERLPATMRMIEPKPNVEEEPAVVQRLAGMAERVTDGILLLDRDLRVQYANPASARLLGRPVADLIGRTHRGLLSLAFEAQLDRGYREVLESNAPVRFESPFDVTGESLWLAIEIHPEPGGLSVLVRDISPSKRGEDAERRDRDRVAAALSATDVGIWRSELPMTGKPFYASPESRRHLGLPLEGDVTVADVIAAHHPEDREEAFGAIAAAVRGEAPYDATCRTVDPDGRVRWIRGTGSVLCDAHGVPCRFDGFTVDVTERVLAEERLRESERKYEAFLSQQSVAITHVDLTGCFCLLNDKACQMLQRPREEVIGTLAASYTHPDDLEESTRQLMRMLQTGEDYRVEKRYLRADGSCVWTDTHASLVRDSAGRPLYIQAVTVDISERMEAERALREREERYRSLTDSIPVMVWTTDLEGDVTFVSTGWREYFAMNLEEARKGSWIEAVHPQDLNRVATAWARCLRERIPISIEYRIRDVDGRYRWHLGLTRPEFSGGEQTGWIGSHIDIQEQKTKEASLRLMVELWQAMRGMRDSREIVAVAARLLGEHLETARCGFAHVDEDGVVLPLGGWAAEGPVPTGDFDAAAFGRPCVPQVQPTLVRCPIARGDRLLAAMTVEEDRPREWTAEEVQLVEMVAHRCWSVIERADNERLVREANEELVRARDAALAAARAKSEFLANMSHEVRTPMNGVLGMTAILMDKDLDADSREIVDTIAASGETLLRVIDDILDFSKIEAGRLEIDRTNVDVASLTGDVVALYQGHAQAKEVLLYAQGPVRPAPRVLADAVRLRQILANLVSNGVKFTSEGEVVVEWTARETEDTVELEIRVRDTGIGIPVERREAIFESFSQADGSTQRKYGGTGLGLTISKRLVELMGGTIEVQSEEGRGSLFTVRLRLERAETQAPVTTATPDADALTFPLRVLLAEDNGVNVKVARRLLERIGCVVEVAENGLRAIAMAGQSAYDLVLMDVQMPLCDGLEATRAIRAQAGPAATRLPIYALTANAMEGDREECLAAGMDGFVAKPVTFEALRAVVMTAAKRVAA